MDLSHIGYLHSNTIKVPSAGEARPTYEGGDEFKSSRWMVDQSPDVPYFRRGLPDNQALLDGVMSSELFSPSLVITSLELFTAESLGERKPIAKFYHLHGITPETLHSTHDFSAMTRNVRHNDPELDEVAKASVHRTRSEDVEALEGSEIHLDSYGDTRTELFGVNDLVGNLVRKHLIKLMDMEQSN